MHRLNRVAVYCGSHYGGHARYERAARDLGAKLAENKVGIVYGGGKIGLMGVLADAALAAGGEVIGVIPSGQMSREIAHRGLTELRVVGSRFEKREVIAELCDGYIAMPGGLGVLGQLGEMALWTQLGLQKKPCGLLNVNKFFDHLIAHFELAHKEGFIKNEHSNIVLHDSDVTRLVGKMRSWAPPD